MRPAFLIALLPLLACEDKEAPAPDARWAAVEKQLDAGLAAVKKRDAAEALPAVQRAVDALQDLVRDDWVALLTFAPPGWTFFKANIQVAAKRAGGGTVGDITGTVNGRRDADGTTVLVSVNSSPAHLDMQRRIYTDPARVAEMKRTMDVETETRAGLPIAKRIYKMRSEVLVMGDHTVLTVTIGKEDKALLAEALGWIDLELFKRLDASAGRSRAK